MCLPQMVPIPTWTATRNIVGHGTNSLGRSPSHPFFKASATKGHRRRGRSAGRGSHEIYLRCGRISVNIIRVLNEPDAIDFGASRVGMAKHQGQASSRVHIYVHTPYRLEQKKTLMHCLHAWMGRARRRRTSIPRVMSNCSSSSIAGLD